MEVLLDFYVFNVCFSELTLGKEVETFTEECSDSELIKGDAFGLIFDTSEHSFFLKLILKSLKFCALVKVIGNQNVATSLRVDVTSMSLQYHL